MSFHGFPDNRFDAVDLLDLVRAVERLVRDTDPDIVLTHFPGDLNIDHALAFRAVLTALRPGCLGRVEKILAFEVPSSTQWAHGRLGGGFAPNVFVDVAGTLERKVAAMEAYGTESRPFPHPRSPRALRAAAGYWGSVAGLDAAEPFELVRWVRGPSGGAL
jgi:LmbE family N-acetylglucosaminyl deacetylase